MMGHGLVLILCGVGLGILIGAALFAGPPANLARSRRVGGYRPEGPPHRVMPDGGIRNEQSGYTYYPPKPPPSVKDGGIGNAKRNGPTIAPVSAAELDASDDD